MHTKFCSENSKERCHLGELGIDGRIILSWIMKKRDLRMWTGLDWLRIGHDGGLL
jgi:hypothetical protein